MPIYEFRCKKCNAHLEVFQKLSDKPPTRCRKCGGRLEKQFSRTAIQFKGEGWYVTDYGKNTSHAPTSKNGEPGSKKEVAKSEDRKAEKKESESKAESKSESKTESKTESKKKAEKK